MNVYMFQEETEQLQVNYLAINFLLTSKLIESLLRSPGSRVVSAGYFSVSFQPAPGAAIQCDPYIDFADLVSLGQRRRLWWHADAVGVIVARSGGRAAIGERVGEWEVAITF